MHIYDVNVQRKDITNFLFWIIMKKVLDNAVAYIYKEKNTKVVFLGHQKSGTTAISALLAHATKLSFSNDPIYRVSPKSAEIMQQLLTDKTAFINTAYNKPSLFFQNIVKDPDYTLSISSILEIYSFSKFVFIARAPHQIIRSIFNRLSINGDTKLKKFSQNQMANCTAGWDFIINGDPKLNDTMSVIERLAHRVEQTTEQYLKHQENLHLVKYEDFSKDKNNYILQLAQTLDITVNSSIEHLLDKQFQPKGNANVPIEFFFGEENYELINRVCAKTMAEFNY